MGAMVRSNGIRVLGVFVAVLLGHAVVADGVSICFWRAWFSDQWIEPKDAAKSLTPFLGEIDAARQTELREMVTGFLSLKEQTPESWLKLLQHSTAEIREWLPFFERKRGGYAVKTARKHRVGRTSLGRFVFGDQLLRLPKRVRDSKHLASILIDLTHAARSRKRTELNALTDGIWWPFSFFSKNHMRRAHVAHLKGNEVFRDLELVMVLAAMDLPVPQKWIKRVTNPKRWLAIQRPMAYDGLVKQLRPPNVEKPRFLEYTFDLRNLAGYGRAHAITFLFALMTFLGSDDDGWLTDTDVSDFGDVGNGRQYLRQDIRRWVRVLKKDGEVTLSFCFPGVEKTVTFLLGRDGGNGTIYFYPKHVEEYERFVRFVIQNRFTGYSVFEQYAMAKQTRMLSFRLAKRLGLWVYFSPEMEKYGLTLENLLLHQWTWQVMSDAIDAYNRNGKAFPEFLVAAQQKRLEALARKIQSKDKPALQDMAFLKVSFDQVAVRPIFGFIRSAMAEDEALYEASKTYVKVRNTAVVVASLYVTSKARMLSTAMRKIGFAEAAFKGTWFPTVVGVTTFVFSYQYLNDLVEDYETTHQAVFRQREAFLMTWEDEYRGFSNNLDKILADASISELPLVRFLSQNSVQDLIRIPQLFIVGRRLALLLKPEVQQKIQQCRDDPVVFAQSFGDSWTQGLDRRVQQAPQNRDMDGMVWGQHRGEWGVASKIEGFLSKALTYPTICELLVLATHWDEREKLWPAIYRIEIFEPASGSANRDVNTKNSVVGSFVGGKLSLWPRSEWPEHVQYYVFAEELWTGVLDHQVAARKSRYASQEQFVQACVLHEVLAHMLQKFVMKAVEDPGVPLWLWIRNTVETRKRMRADAERVANIQAAIREDLRDGKLDDVDAGEIESSRRGTYITAYFMHMIEPFPKNDQYAYVWDIYHRFYEAYR